MKALYYGLAFAIAAGVAAGIGALVLDKCPCKCKKEEEPQEEAPAKPAKRCRVSDNVLVVEDENGEIELSFRLPKFSGYTADVAGNDVTYKVVVDWGSVGAVNSNDFEVVYNRTMYLKEYFASVSMGNKTLADFIRNSISSMTSMKTDETDATRQWTTTFIMESCCDIDALTAIDEIKRILR